MRILTDAEMLGCSLVGGYPFEDVKDVIKEACLHQAELTLKEVGKWLLKDNRYLDFGKKEAETLARGEMPE